MVVVAGRSDLPVLQPRLLPLSLHQAAVRRLSSWGLHPVLPFYMAVLAVLLQLIPLP